MKKRILFVDDQPNILAGLRRMLRGLRHEWDMEFAKSGSDALARLADTPFDVVISDMRMPGMDGAQLLGEVMQRYPETVRIVLSGQSEQETILRSVGPAHQYLSKPCDPETLKTTVARACALRDKLADESLKRLVSQITTLPSLPNIYTQLVEELQSPDASVQRVAELISQDVAMTAKLLQMVNSSFFGLPQRVESPAQAAILLGLNLLYPLVISASIFSQFEGNFQSGYSLEQLTEHSLAVSVLAQRIAASQCDTKEIPGDSLLAGLLHDVGQLVLITNLPERYHKTLSLADEERIALCEAEADIFGATHADVGAYLLGLWGLPDTIVEAVAFHHEPSKCPNTCFSALTAVHVANVLENQAYSVGEIEIHTEPDADYLETLGMTNQFPLWKKMVRESTSAGAPS